MFYSLIMALIMLALGIVSFWGRNQDSFEGLDPAAFFYLRAFDQRVQAQPGLLLSGLDFICRLADAGRDAADGDYHVWRLFTYPVMVLLPFLLIMTINAQLDQALNERKSELYAAAKQD